MHTAYAAYIDALQPKVAKQIEDERRARSVARSRRARAQWQDPAYRARMIALGRWQRTWIGHKDRYCDMLGLFESDIRKRLTLAPKRPGERRERFRVWLTAAEARNAGVLDRLPEVDRDRAARAAPEDRIVFADFL